MCRLEQFCMCVKTSWTATEKFNNAWVTWKLRFYPPVIHGFHVYQQVWQPHTGEWLKAEADLPLLYAVLITTIPLTTDLENSAAYLPEFSDSRRRNWIQSDWKVTVLSPYSRRIEDFLLCHTAWEEVGNMNERDCSRRKQNWVELARSVLCKGWWSLLRWSPSSKTVSSLVGCSYVAGTFVGTPLSWRFFHQTTEGDTLIGQSCRLYSTDI